MVNLLPPMNEMMFPTIAQDKMITPITPETNIDWVSLDDIRRFAAEAFAQPAKYNNREFSITDDKLTMLEVADVMSPVINKRFEAISITEQKPAPSGFFKWGVDSYHCQYVADYKVDTQEIAEFGIQPESLKTFLESN